jgi:hypothetical protein
MCQRGRVEKIKKCVDNAGGNASGLIPTIDVAAKTDVSSIPGPAAGTYTIDTDIAMVSDTRTAAEVTAGDPATPVPGTFHEWDFSEVGFNYTAPREGEDEDGNRLHTLTGAIPKMSALKDKILDATAGGVEHIIRFKDRNGLVKIMGDNNEGCKIVFEPSTDGRNLYNLIITWKKSRLLYEYTGAIALSV